ncbi:hypothetical protein POM88_015728 [Heracleum sosnowskyi]|uniref:Uncharacterized protein n=1 Tax=Heracleum sosnowskyi TaxID=360622 RepID=A0AAD8IP88_9APIA|nr:hypothetical protein POM88_015728 [Heracleum sosnowskyi]
MINLKHMDKLLTTKGPSLSGVTAMPDFLRNSSSRVQKNSGKRTTFLPSYATRKFGRKRTMLMPRIFFQIGVVFNAISINLGMFIFGKLALGHGVGFANQAVPLILSKIAPTRIKFNREMMLQRSKHGMERELDDRESLLNIKAPPPKSLHAVNYRVKHYSN